ncbi:MAG: alpha/beta fold hydrolase [Thermoanaerobaculum sp.]
MAKPLKVFLVLVAFGLLALGVGAFLVFRYPLAVNAARERLSLRFSGFKAVPVATSVGKVRAFVGGSGSCVVFLHGAGDHAGTWSRVVPGLTRQFRVIALDLPGHGGSEPKVGPLPMNVVFYGTRQAVQQLCPEGPVMVVGNSLGAWLACLLAAEEKRVAQVVLVNGGPIPGHYLGPTLAPKTREEAREVMKVLMGPSGAAIPGFILDDVVRAGQAGPIARLLETLSSWENYVWQKEELSQVTVPVFLLWGEEDRLFDRVYAQKLLQAFPHVQADWLAGCGHIPQRQCPAAFTQKLLQLLSRGS